MTEQIICKVDGCDKAARHVGWCLAHYKRWHRHGDPLAGAAPHYANPSDAFEARTVKDLATGCLLWVGSHDEKGYGQLRINRKIVKAHRFSWKAAHGDIPDGMLVLHRCDNPPCVNPSHLFLGTHTDNSHDMDAKGRRVNNQAKGAMCHAAKLTDEDIVAIRSDTRRQVDIAADYGVTQSNVSKIKLKQAWAHVK